MSGPDKLTREALLDEYAKAIHALVDAQCAIELNAIEPIYHGERLTQKRLDAICKACSVIHGDPGSASSVATWARKRIDCLPVGSK